MIDREKYKKYIYEDKITNNEYKELYSDKYRAIKLFKGCIKEGWINDLEADDLNLVKKSYIESEYKDIEKDIVYKTNVSGTEVLFYILLDFQADIDYSMPLRMFFYVCEILREYSTKAEYCVDDKKIKIPVICPFILYNSDEVEKSDGMPAGVKNIIDNTGFLENNILDFKYNIFHMNRDLQASELIESIREKSIDFLMRASRNMLNKGMEPKEISELLEVSIELVEKIKDEISNE